MDLRRLPPKVLFRFGLLVAFGVISLLVLLATPVRDHLTQENVVSFFEQVGQTWWAPLLLLGAFLAVSLMGLPVSPIVVGGGVTFGAFVGAGYNMLGLFLGAAASFFLGKYLGRDFVVHMAGDRLKQVELAFERSGFWPLVQSRFLPIPFSIINYGAALAGAKTPLFLLSTAIGLAPTTLMHTFFASMIFRSSNNEERLRWTVLYLSCWGALAILTSIPTLRQAWRRRAVRRDRAKESPGPTPFDPAS